MSVLQHSRSFRTERTAAQFIVDRSLINTGAFVALANDGYFYVRVNGRSAKAMLLWLRAHMPYDNWLILPAEGESMPKVATP